MPYSPRALGEFENFVYQSESRDVQDSRFVVADQMYLNFEFSM